ncbi:tryptophan--tRNA ligase [Salinadaptatus halalkaliphilus]|uniref:Tryptophan--tRNA ligase n=1 Tax=Salinadaptatus halalkaliphilus TaxID=2419781 RepID=A0A4S3TN76_9EURY|nr:tryptophan--tRNA ligase [Salinadaptatus halalkaliphilus]THE65754.1 tryptophan--tRNA ligase [Salinadaptatus halalkaliphilus]
MTGDDPLEESESGEPPTDGGDGTADPQPGLRPDGGAAGADDVALDPWGSSSVSDYRNLFEEFGIEEFDDILPDVANPHYLMRRGVIFGHRDFGPVAEALRNDEPAAVLSGFMPTGDPHIGHKLVFDEIIWHQQQGADAYALIADLEANSARGMSWAEIDEHARSYLLSLLALGFDPEEGTLYRQSTNREVQDLAFDLGAEANFSEFQAIYGFDGETDVSHMQSVVTQMADILYPQLEEPKPTVIPVGPDQDPHVRLARDLAERMRYFKVSEAYASFELEPDERDLVAEYYDRLDPAEFDDDQLRCTHVADALAETPLAELETDADTLSSVLTKLEEAGMEPIRPRTRFFDRRATEDAFEALIDAVDGEKRVYESHVDAFEIDRAEAEELAREIEVDTGGYGFQPPSSIYHRFMTGLTGGKMSSSIPASHISLLDDPEDGYDKVKSATTGGRETAEEQREKGGRADECPVYELYAYLLAGDDDEFAKRVYDECVGGDRLCGDCKEQAAQLMQEFLTDHQEKREEVEELLEEADIELESPRRR